MVNSFDVAKFARVSQATVSRALRGDPRVSETTRARVEDAAQKLGYVPNAAGRALSSGKTNRIGLLVTDLENEFYHRTIAPIARRLSERNKEMVLMVESEDGMTTPNRVQAMGLDGVILATTTLDSFVPFYLREREIPFVYFNRTNPSVPSDSAVVDSSAGFFDMLNAIFGSGHTRIALIQGPQNSTTGRRRSLALQGFLAARGIQISAEHMINAEFTISAGMAAFDKLWHQDEKPSVVICGNDTIAMGFINQAYRENIEIPRDVSVVGFDNIAEAALPIYDLSTVGYDLEELAVEAVNLLLGRIDSAEGEFIERAVPSYFVNRGSLGTPAI